MPDPYMPSVVVEIAFSSGYTTPDASRVWTDVSDYVELHNLLNITVGRQDERSTADANSLTLTLDNKDGRFTAGRSASPYYPNVKIGRPIRVRVTPPGGSASTRFVGFIDEWPVEWDGSDAYAKTTIRASSRLARLGLSAKLRSMIEAEILSARPHRYWTLGDPSGSSLAAESSGNGGDPLSAVVRGTPFVFGNATGPGFDDLTAAEFLGANGDGDYLAGALTSTSGPSSLSLWLLVSGLPSSGVGPPFSSTVAIGGGLSLRISTTGSIIAGATAGPNINDGRGHHIAVVRDGSTEVLYLDGVAVDSAATGISLYSSTMAVGQIAGSMAHVAFFDTALTATQVAAQAEVVLSGASGDTTDERMMRILGWAGVPAAEASVDTGSESMTYQQTAGQSAVDALRDVESTEGGVLFDGRDGRVTFHSRSRRYLAIAAATLNMASQHVGTDFAPKLDRSALANDVTVENPTTQESARQADAASRDEYGVATTSARSLAASSDALAQRASWLLASYAEPRTRVPSLTVDVLAHQGLTPSAHALLGLTVGDLLAVTNAPTQADTTSQSYFVEGYTETIGPQSYGITFNLSPTYPTLSTFVLGDPIRGVLDGGMVLGL